ncbi:MAG: hypothetical protein Kow0010_09680 [Dehalococcoidia bacterium]
MISAILLAAGSSTRMGMPKALLDWGGQPLVRYQVEQLCEAGVDEVIVVLGYRGDDIRRLLRGLNCRAMLNPRFQLGRAGSLRIGAKATAYNTDAIIVVNVDQPRPAAFYRDLIAAHRPGAAATRPTANGRHGHPVIVSGSLRTELLEASDADEGLRGILARHAGEVVDIPADEVCLLDINTPEEYTAAHEALGQRA